MENKKNRKKRVAAIGDNCIDLYTELKRYYCTGNAVDFAVHMQRLGIQTSLISVTGNDRYGTQMRRELEKEGIDLSHFYTAEGQTAVSYMELVGKERTYGDYVEGVMENVEFSDKDIAFAGGHDLVHTAFWGNAQKYLPDIRRFGAEIVFDYATEKDDPLVEETVPYVTYAFFSFEKDGEDTRAFLKEIVKKGPVIAAATFGEKGSVAWDGADFHTCGICKSSLVNTVGAGDSYIAGFMNGILNGYSIEDCMAQGAKVAAEVVGTFGPWTKKEG